MPAIFAAPDRLGLVGDLIEPVPLARTPVGEVDHQLLLERTVLEAAKADELQAAVAATELIIAAELVLPLALLFVTPAVPVGPAGAAAARLSFDAPEIGGAQ